MLEQRPFTEIPMSTFPIEVFHRTDEIGERIASSPPTSEAFQFLVFIKTAEDEIASGQSLINLISQQPLPGTLGSEEFTNATVSKIVDLKKQYSDMNQILFVRLKEDAQFAKIYTELEFSIREMENLIYDSISTSANKELALTSALLHRDLFKLIESSIRRTESKN